MAEVVIGIDPGLGATGWAVLWPGDSPRVVCGSWTTSKDDGTNRQRVRILGRRALALIVEHRPTLVAVEGYVWQGAGPKARVQSFQGASVTPRVLERVLACADFHDVPAVEITPSTAKRRVGIKGKISHEVFLRAFPDFEGRSNEHGRDAAIIAYAGWMGPKGAKARA